MHDKSEQLGTVIAIGNEETTEVASVRIPGSTGDELNFRVPLK